MSIAGDILQAAVGSALNSGGGGGEWFDLAMSMVGNEGQATLIEEIGYDFDSVWDEGQDDGDFSEVNDLSSHPEAISEILSEIEVAMNDKWEASQEDEVENSVLGGILGLIDAVFF